jgi:hypothetical protein
MIISFSVYAPLPGDPPLSVTRQGDGLSINGDTIDFSVIPEGARVPEAHTLHSALVGDVTRVGGAIHLTLRLPHRPHPAAYVENPPPLVNPPNGPLALPEV